MKDKFKYLFTSKWTLPFAALLVVVLSVSGVLKGYFADVIYFKYIYQSWRVIYDYTLGLLPFATIYILFFILFPILYMTLVKPIQEKKWKILFNKTLNLFSGICLLFYFLWGFNYQQKSLASKLNLPEIILSKDDLLSEINLVHANLISIRENLELTNDSIQKKDLPTDLETTLRKNQKEILKSWSMPVAGRVRVRKLQPKGILLRISTAGVYIPFVSEGHIDKGLHPVQWPFTMAHEMAHGYGITDEGECNFVAFVTCLNAKNRVIKYSGYMGYYRYLLSNFRRYYGEEYGEVFNNINPKILKDIISINNELEKYPDILPNVRDKIYDTYLKTHGIKAGLHSYSTIIQLVNRWKNSDYNQELVKQIFAESEHE